MIRSEYNGSDLKSESRSGVNKSGLQTFVREKAVSEWQQFEVGKLSPKGFNSACVQFDIVRHTSHVSSAISVVEAGELQPSLVFDESKLNDQRILVVWLSPNHWGTGYRYGTVRFSFPFRELIKGRRYYWVESIAYKIRACRILITDVQRDLDLQPYNPEARDGPWWFDSRNDEHYFNNNYCLEFMLEASIDLKCLEKFNFVNHHKRYCSVHRYNPILCSELGMSALKGGALFLTRAAVVGTNLKWLSKHFVQEGKPAFELAAPFSEFVIRLSRKVAFNGPLAESCVASVATMRAAMSAFTYDRLDEAKQLAANFESEAAFINVAAKVFADIVGLEDWKTLRDA
jgi:hypothetical protein